MLIRQAEIWGRGIADLRIAAGRVAEIGTLTAAAGERILEARGGALLPGLHDHHLHLMSYAAALDSLACGPPAVTNEAALIEALTAQRGKRGWVRGYRYHESVAGDIDRHWLDRWLPDTPARIQHRSGRLWIVNSAGLEVFDNAAREERAALSADGRIYDQDDLLGRLIGRILPPLGSASRRLAACGVTGLTDMTPGNGPDTLELFRNKRADGTLLQRVCVAGRLALGSGSGDLPISVGPTKIHLHESNLPTFETLCATIRHSHRIDRPVAVHCVTEVELVFALAALDAAPTRAGDRIEHASVTPPALLEQMRALGLTVVTQPNFIAERGDAYIATIPPREHDWLYRCRSFLDSGIPLAGGTDAPFGDADPWLAIRSAVTRATREGATLGDGEALTPEAALALFLGRADAPAAPRTIARGAVADLCLLSAPWREARERLSSDLVAATIIDGSLVIERVDETPVQRGCG